MSIITAAYAAPAAKAPLERTIIERRTLDEHDILIEIAYCGICHSDIHQVRDEWAEGSYPMVPGHEIAGVVADVGFAVTRYAVGDRVGVGCFVDSCRHCDSCRAGEDQYCRRGVTMTYNDRDATGASTYGGYSSHIVVDENYVLRIPDGLGLDVAAPLLCAGTTTYSALTRWNVGPGKRVAIVGLGGLGHTGVKIARALGAEVTVLSQTDRKRDDALRLGAHHFQATGAEATFTELAESFDLILNTVSVTIDLDAYLGLLRVDGTLVNVGAPEHPCTLNMFSLITGRKSIAGSMIGSIRQTQEMLDFCGSYGFGADIETVCADQINDAYDHVLRGDVRFRFVIDIASM